MTQSWAEDAWPNPKEPAQIEFLDPPTLGLVMALIERSEGSGQLALREAELDALWSLADLAAQAGEPGSADTLAIMWEAHEALGHNRRSDAIDALGRARERLVAKG